MASRFSAFLSELKRRKVYHVAVIYVVVGWGVVTGAQFLFQEVIDLPEAAWQFVAGLVVLGFPIALVLAWAYEVKPEEEVEPQSGPAKPQAEKGDPEKKSIVVLPFDNLSPDPADAYFSGGLTEELTATLSQLRSLRVISRSSATVYKEAFKDVRTIADDLGVQFLLEGSVRKAGDDLRITVQLIDAKNDEHLWAEKYDGKLEDVFGMQEDVSRSIAESLEIRLGPGEERSVAVRPISDPRAYDTYLLAMYESRRVTEEGMTRAVNLIEEALAGVGDNAFLFAAMAKCMVMAYDFGFRRGDEVLPEVEAWAEKALALDPDLSFAHYARAYARYKRGDFKGFVQGAKRSLELEHTTDAAALLAFVLAEVGKMEEASEYAEAAVARDPLSFFAFWGTGSLEIFYGRPENAVSMAEDATSLIMTEESFALWWMAQSLGYAGNEGEARAVFEKVVGQGSGFLSDLSEMYVRALSNDAAGIRTVLDREGVRETANTDEYFPLYIANAFVRVGEGGEALIWLEKAIEWGFTNHEFLSKHNRYLEPLRGDPAFEALMEKAREKQAAFDL